MKKKLSLVQIACFVIASILPYIEGIVNWNVWTLSPPENISSKGMSLDNLMNTQLEGFASFLFWTFYVLIVLAAVYIVMDIFDLFDHGGMLGRIGESKAMVVLPILVLVLYIIMMIVADNHSTTFQWRGQIRYTGVTLGILAYIQLIPLVSAALVEIYKQFVLKKGITQEEN